MTAFEKSQNNLKLAILSVLFYSMIFFFVYCLLKKNLHHSLAKHAKTEVHCAKIKEGQSQTKQ